jgi:Na+-transporting NADH:ubiquinone oxidoreductase subunit F
MWIEFWITVGTMCGIAGLLAVIVLIADATVGDYGTVELTVNERKKLLVPGGRPLLSTLKEQGIFIPSACGGRGSCGLCKVQIVSGAGSPVQTELPWLNEDERRRQVRLGCQVKVKAALQVRIPEELLSVRQYRTVVTSMRDLTHDIKEVRLQLTEPAEMDFIAGQFIQLEVPAYELTEEPVYRAYSISSPPSSRNEIELEIRLVPNGICTTYVHRHLKKGDAVTINGPYGEFFRRDGESEMICIAGGSGMAPIKSLLNDMLDKGIKRPARYFFGARSRRDLFLMDEMKALEKKLPTFQFIPALSAPMPEDQWSGETGLITDVVARHVPDASGKEAYLCGSPLMIDACIKVLKAKGMAEDRIYFDKFA